MPHQAPTGTDDILPERVIIWRRMEEAAHTVMSRFGYHEIRTPVFEYTPLFVRSVGETTDIVEKEMYTFEPAASDSVTLRPELTAPVIRAYLEHDYPKRKAFQKWYYLGPLFRRERPQKGRSRQFHQLGVEAIGASDPLLDAETIILAARFLEELGLNRYEVVVNTIGCPTCRSGYRKAVREHLQPSLGKLCENCNRRFDRNVFRVLDCKREECRRISGTVPSMELHLCRECRDHHARLLEALSTAGAHVREDKHLVRGFDYYTRTVYELTYPSLGILAGGTGSN